MGRLPQHRYLLGILVCLISGIAIFLLEQNVEQKFRQEVSKSLVSLVQTTQTAANIMTSKNRQTVISTVTIPTLIENTQRLIKASENSETLVNHPAKKIIDELTRQIISIYKYEHYYILTPDRKVLISSNDQTVNFDRLHNQQPEFLNNIWKDKAQLTYPHKSTLEIQTEVKSAAPEQLLLLIGAAIKDADDNIIAALIFATDPEEEYGPIYSRAQIGETGETYVVYFDGLLLTQSRFDEQLQQNGILAKGKSSTLNLNIDISKMIDLRSFNFKQNSISVNLDGYTNYRQKTVVGAWLWVSDYKVFIITEVEKSQAFASINEIRKITIVTFILFTIFLMALIFLFNKYTKKLDASNNLLVKSKLRLRLAFENIPSGSVVSDWFGIIEEFSKSAEAIFGYTAEEMIGKNVNVLMPDPNHSNHNQYIKRYLETGKGIIVNKGGYDTTALHKNGHTIPIHLCLGTMVIENELHFIASITDQTLQTKIEQQLYNFQKMKAVGQLAGGLAHDFNNLLAIAMGNLQLLQRKADLDADSDQKILTALQALNRGATLTSQLLNFTRTDIQSTSTMNINDGILEIKNLIEQTATKKITISYALADNLGSVDINSGEFGDALINLTSNARDAMPQGGNLLIETSVCSTDVFTEKIGANTSNIEYIQLTITDTGEGIATEQQKRIFEPFYTTKERSKGTGLGLAMVFNFVKHSGGQIQVHSEVGIGTSFKLFFPVSLLPDKPKVISIPDPVVGGKETILLVDDEIELLAIAEANLGDAGYKIITANSGEQALEIIKNNTIDLLFSDIIMPNGMDGFELVIEAIYISPALKVALTSGFSAKVGDKQVEGNLYARYLAHTLLPKPYDRIELLNYIRQHLDRKRLINWSQQLSIGVSAIDNDHRALVAIINRLNYIICEDPDPDTDSLDIDTCLSELAVYMDEHHRREEIVMKACKYPNNKEHLKVHQALEQRFTDFISKLNTQTNRLEKQQLVNLLTNMMSAHISADAKQIAPFAANYADAIHLALKADIEQSSIKN